MNSLRLWWLLRRLRSGHWSHHDSIRATLMTAAAKEPATLSTLVRLLRPALERVTTGGEADVLTYVIKHCGDVTAGSELLPLLRHTDARFRCVAAEILGGIGGTAFIRSLLEQLQKEIECSARRALIRALLGHLDDPGVSDAIASICTQIPHSSLEFMLITEALARRSDVRVIPPLCEALRNGGKKPDEHTQHAQIQLFVMSRNTAQVAAHFQHHPPSNEIGISTAIRVFEQVECTAEIAKLLFRYASQCPDHKVSACQALMGADRRVVVPTLLDAVRTLDSEALRIAADLLSKLGDESVLPSLEDRVNSSVESPQFLTETSYSDISDAYRFEDSGTRKFLDNWKSQKCLARAIDCIDHKRSCALEMPKRLIVKAALGKYREVAAFGSQARNALLAELAFVLWCNGANDAQRDVAILSIVESLRDLGLFDENVLRASLGIGVPQIHSRQNDTVSKLLSMYDQLIPFLETLFTSTVDQRTLSCIVDAVRKTNVHLPAKWSTVFSLLLDGRWSVDQDHDAAVWAFELLLRQGHYFIWQSRFGREVLRSVTSSRFVEPVVNYLCDLQGTGLDCAKDFLSLLDRILRSKPEEVDSLVLQKATLLAGVTQRGNSDLYEMCSDPDFVLECSGINVLAAAELERRRSSNPSR